MVKDLRICRLLVITRIGIIWGGKWIKLHTSASQLYTMSRCYPYPLPGYEKKVQAELALTHKKEKLNHKNEKKKRKRGNNANGEKHGFGLWIHLPVLTDKDKRSKKSQRAQLVNDDTLCIQNGSKFEVKGPLGPFESQLFPGIGIAHGRKPINDCQNPLLSIRREEANGSKLDWLPLQSKLPAAGSCNGVSNAVVCSSEGRDGGGEMSESCNGVSTAVLCSSEGHDAGGSEKRENGASLGVLTQVWSTFDDQEWLFVSTDAPLTKLRTRTEQDDIFCVWQEARQLPSVDVYALPYVIPY